MSKRAPPASPGGQVRTSQITLRAAAIARPITHDVCTQIVGQRGGQMRRVEITRLADNAFHAALTLGQAGRKQTHRHSAVRCGGAGPREGAPSSVAETVLEQAGVVREAGAESPESSEPASGIDESKLSPLREFIESLETDDLGGSTGQS